MVKSDLAWRCALSLLLVGCTLALVGWGGRSLGKMLASDDARELDVRLSRWMDGNYSAEFAWRTAVDGQRTFTRLRSLPHARVLRAPALPGRESPPGPNKKLT